jgi:hypothetical protein
VETIDVDANMVVANVLKLTVLYGVKLNCKDVIVGVAVVLVIE